MVPAHALSSPVVLRTAPSVQSLWDDIVRWSMEACVLRKEGKESEVAVVLQERLPSLIREWSAVCGLPAATAKENLRALFRRVEESMETGYVQRRMIIDAVCAKLAADQPQVRARGAKVGSVHLRRRIPIDDVPGMLDAVAEAEVETRHPQLLPVTA